MKKTLSNNKAYVFFHELLLSVFKYQSISISLRHFEDLRFQIKTFSELTKQSGDIFSTD